MRRFGRSPPELQEFFLDPLVDLDVTINSTWRCPTSSQQLVLLFKLELESYVFPVLEFLTGVEVHACEKDHGLNCGKVPEDIL